MAAGSRRSLARASRPAAGRRESGPWQALGTTSHHQALQYWSEAGMIPAEQPPRSGQRPSRSRGARRSALMCPLGQRPQTAHRRRHRRPAARSAGHTRLGARL
jgi:hypothetical protein